MEKVFLASTPQPPYYAVIFSSVKNEVTVGYDSMAEDMNSLAMQQPGYLGVESARNGLGITVSYWLDLESVAKWKSDTRHLFAQKMGRDEWYTTYKVRICKVERDYGF